MSYEYDAAGDLVSKKNADGTVTDEHRRVRYQRLDELCRTRQTQPRTSPALTVTYT